MDRAIWNYLGIPKRTSERKIRIEACEAEADFSEAFVRNERVRKNCEPLTEGKLTIIEGPSSWGGRGDEGDKGRLERYDRRMLSCQAGFQRGGVFQGKRGRFSTRRGSPFITMTKEQLQASFSMT